MAKKKKASPAHRGEREKRVTIRCVVCDDAFESSRVDALCCSPACRKQRSRDMVGGFAQRSPLGEVTPKRIKAAKGPPLYGSRKK